MALFILFWCYFMVYGFAVIYIVFAIFYGLIGILLSIILFWYHSYGFAVIYMIFSIFYGFIIILLSFILF